ncbi:MAG: hypothetical protein ACI3ZI_08550 [Candidatus Cryptobacteroides sp.]
MYKYTNYLDTEVMGYHSTSSLSFLAIAQSLDEALGLLEESLSRN